MSKNVYADLDFPGPDEMLVKAGLVLQINRLIKSRALTQAKTAEITGIPQSRLSAVLRGQFRDISIERLMDGLRALGCGIETIVRPQNSVSAGKLTVLGGENVA